MNLAYAELATYYEGGCTRVMHGVYGRTCIQAADQVLTRRRTAAIARENSMHTSKRTGVRESGEQSQAHQYTYWNVVKAANSR